MKTKLKTALSNEITNVSLDYLPPNEELGAEMPTSGLVEKIRLHGVLEPIIVKLPEKGILYEPLSGRRRIKASRILGLKTIPCRVIDPKVDSEVLTVMFHQTRKENPVVEFEAIQALLAKDYTEEDICTMTDMPIQRYRNIISLNRLGESIYDGVKEGKVKPTTAYQIAKCTPFQIELLGEVLNRQGSLKSTDVYKIKRVTKEAVVNNMSNEIFSLPDTAIAPTAKDEEKTPLRLLNEIKIHCSKHNDPELNNMLQELELKIFTIEDKIEAGE